MNGASCSLEGQGESLGVFFLSELLNPFLLLFVFSTAPVINKRKASWSISVVTRAGFTSHCQPDCSVSSTEAHQLCPHCVVLLCTHSRHSLPRVPLVMVLAPLCFPSLQGRGGWTAALERVSSALPGMVSSASGGS